MALDIQTQMRLTGMASGLDTDAVIQNLGRVHTLRINKVKQDRQLLVWKQESYRDTISKLSNFMKSNLNIANPMSNMRSAAAYALFSYSVKGKAGGIDASELMSISATGDLKNFSQTVQAVTQLATKDKYEGKVTDLQGITTKGFNYYNFGMYDDKNGIATYDPDTKWAMIGISIDGTSRTISIRPAELVQAYHEDKQKGGGEFKVMKSGSQDLALEKIVDKLAKGIGNTDGIFIRKADGSISAIDEDDAKSIYAMYEKKHEFAVKGEPNAAEKEAAIREYFSNTAIYEKNPQVHNKLSDDAKNSVVNDFEDDTKNYFDDITIETFFIEDGSGGYTQLKMADICKWYGDNQTPPVTIDPAITQPPSDEKKAAVRAYFEAHDIYGGLQDPPPMSSEAMAKLLNDKIKALYGDDFGDIVTATKSGELKFQKQGSTITLFDPQAAFDAVSKGMGLKGGATSAGAVNNTLITDLIGKQYFDQFGVFDSEKGTFGVPITINGATITVTDKDTVGTLMNKLGNSEAGVTLSFTASTNRFTLESKDEGTANIIKWGDPATQIFFLHAFGMDSTDPNSPTHTKAQNFEGIINGEKYIRQSNTFTHEGMTFTFNKTFDTALRDSSGALIDKDGNPTSTPVYDPIKLEVTKNTADIVTKIKNFIDEYNTIVTHLNDLIKGKVIRKNGAIEYPPLTEEERKALSAEEVKLYEEKAKSGIMANDSQLRKILNDMRTAIYQKVEGVGISMSDIGITSSANYMDGGLLVVDETKLKAALDKNYDGVVSLFTKASSIPYSDKKNSDKRAAESGIAQRLNDIFTAAAGTSAGGEKGYLLEKAGMVNDRTQADNAITKQLNDYDKKIDKMLERWYRQEQNYYMMFARMETAMSKLQAQQNSLAQIMAAGAGGGK